MLEIPIFWFLFPTRNLNRVSRTSFKHLFSLSVYEIYSAKRVGLHLLFRIKFSCIERTYSAVSYIVTRLTRSSIYRANNNNELTKATYVCTMIASKFFFRFSSFSLIRFFHSRRDYTYTWLFPRMSSKLYNWMKKRDGRTFETTRLKL